MIPGGDGIVMLLKLFERTFFGKTVNIYNERMESKIDGTGVSAVGRRHEQYR